MTTAKTHIREIRNRELRTCKAASARTALEGFDHGRELDVLTFGQFSLLDAIEALLDVTGSADVTIATWTAASADLSRSAEHLHDGRIASLRMIIDRSFISRQPKYAHLVTELFGVDAVRTTRVHAKFALIHNAEWSVTVRTSMNLNENPRLEYLQVCDDVALHGFYAAAVADLWVEEPGGIGGKRNLPQLSSLIDTQQDGVEMGRTIKMGL